MFIYAFNPNARFPKNKMKNSLTECKGKTVKRVFKTKKPFISTRQSNNLQKLHARAKFEKIARTISQKAVGLFTCQDKRCRLNNLNYIKPCSLLSCYID